MRRVVIIGLDAGRWQAVRAAFAGYEDAPEFVAAGQDQRDWLVKDLVAGEAGADAAASLPEAGGSVIVFFAGFDGRESSRCIDQTRGLFGPDVIFAGLTTTNAGWPLARLVAELVAERAAFKKRSATVGPEEG
ncbi:MAG TPA: DUF3783 domain-containing protein [Spirochaetota bacterium]|nr:DUF3783 domain-containing protein [Spirochaetota bacterium]